MYNWKHLCWLAAMPLLLATRLALSADTIECDAMGKIVALAAKTPADENAVVAGAMYVEPSTRHSLGFEWLIERDVRRFRKRQTALGIEHPNLDGDIGDARLRPDSSAVDAGLVIPNVTDGFAGEAPDLGAYEAGAPLPHYGPRPRPNRSHASHY